MLIVVVAVMCLAEYGWDDDGGRLLPLLGAAVFALLALTWLASAGDFLADA